MKKLALVMIALFGLSAVAFAEEQHGAAAPAAGTETTAPATTEHKMADHGKKAAAKKAKKAKKAAKTEGEQQK